MMLLHHFRIPLKLVLKYMLRKFEITVKQPKGYVKIIKPSWINYSGKLTDWHCDFIDYNYLNNPLFDYTGS